MFGRLRAISRSRSASALVEVSPDHDGDIVQSSGSDSAENQDHSKLLSRLLPQVSFKNVVSVDGKRKHMSYSATEISGQGRVLRQTDFCVVEDTKIVSADRYLLGNELRVVFFEKHSFAILEKFEAKEALRENKTWFLKYPILSLNDLNVLEIGMVGQVANVFQFRVYKDLIYVASSEPSSEWLDFLKSLQEKSLQTEPKPVSRKKSMKSLKRTLSWHRLKFVKQDAAKVSGSECGQKVEESHVSLSDFGKSDEFKSAAKGYFWDVEKWSSLGHCRIDVSHGQITLQLLPITGRVIFAAEISDTTKVIPQISKKNVDAPNKAVLSLNHVATTDPKIKPVLLSFGDSNLLAEFIDAVVRIQDKLKATLRSEDVYSTIVLNEGIESEAARDSDTNVTKRASTTVDDENFTEISREEVDEGKIADGQYEELYSSDENDDFAEESACVTNGSTLVESQPLLADDLWQPVTFVAPLKTEYYYGDTDMFTWWSDEPIAKAVNYWLSRSIDELELAQHETVEKVSTADSFPNWATFSEKRNVANLRDDEAFYQEICQYFGPDEKKQAILFYAKAQGRLYEENAILKRELYFAKQMYYEMKQEAERLSQMLQ